LTTPILTFIFLFSFAVGIWAGYVITSLHEIKKILKELKDEKKK